MTARTVLRLAVPMFFLAAVAAACGGDDSGPTNTPPGSDAVSGSPTEQASVNPSDPARAVAVFASPEGTHAALAAIAARGDVPVVLLSGSSRDPASFADIALAEGTTTLGTSGASTARGSGDFDELYLDITGEEATDVARQVYDSVYIATLAAIGVNSTGGGAVTEGAVFVSNPPGEIVGPDDFSHAAEVIVQGTEIDYTGISGFVDQSATLEVSKGAVEVWRLQGADALTVEIRDVDAAAEVGAIIPSGSLVRSAEPQEAPLVLGILAPIDPDTGDPSGPVGTAALIAVSEINDAGGAFGQGVEIVAEEPSQGAAQLLIDAGANVIIGPTEPDSASAAVSAASLVGVPVFAFVDVPTSGSFFRMTPPQTLQTAVLANLALEQDADVTCVLYESGSGDVLAAAFQAAMEHKNGVVRAGIPFAAGDDLVAALEQCISG